MSFSLLEFEQNRAARTTVIDDQSDYFDSSAHWLTDEQRQEAAAKEKAFMERVDRRRRDIPVEFSIDIAGRCIYGVADTPLFPEGSNSGSDAPVTPNVGDGETGSGSSTEQGTAPSRVRPGFRGSRGPTVDLMGPSGAADMSLGARHGVLKDEGIGRAVLDGRASEIYALLMANVLSDRGGAGSGGGAGPLGGGRVQHDADKAGGVCVHQVAALDDAADEAVGCFEPDPRTSADTVESEASAGAAGLEGVGAFVDDHGGDLGVCMSMHQPWASLAVCGVKQIEGRDWPTEHRGRLWIAGAAGFPCMLLLRLVC